MKHLLCLYLKCGSKEVFEVSCNPEEFEESVKASIEDCEQNSTPRQSHWTRLAGDDGSMFSVATDQIVGYSIQPAQEAT